jgi:hypothetical protein
MNSCETGGGKNMTAEFYQCQTCKKTTKVASKEEVPSCCGKPMQKVPLDICLKPDHAEHARPMDEDQPCDDFRAGNQQRR